MFRAEETYTENATQQQADLKHIRSPSTSYYCCCGWPSVACIRVNVQNYLVVSAAAAVVRIYLHEKKHVLNYDHTCTGCNTPRRTDSFAASKQHATASKRERSYRVSYLLWFSLSRFINLFWSCAPVRLSPGVLDLLECPFRDRPHLDLHGVRSSG